MRVAVIGTGHVGLVTCVVLAEIGHDVKGTDSDQERIAGLQRGLPPFYEPGVQALLARYLTDGRIGFTHSIAEAVTDAEVVFICVGTPPRADGEANLLAVERAARDIARHASPGTLVVEKSTVPAGTAERVRLTLARQRPDAGFEVACNPEFLREGTALQDSLHPDRILVGADAPHAFEVLRHLYTPLIDAGYRLIETDLATAELAKHASNAFLALKVSFINAIARLCERTGADVVTVAEVMGADPRIGSAFLQAGLGYGGFCLPKDIPAFERFAAQAGYDFPLLKEVARINEEAVTAAVGRVHEALWNLEGKHVAVLGVAYKPGTDDVRLSPAIELARRLLGAGARVVAYDPQASTGARTELAGLEIAPTAYDAVTGAHCLVVGTAWDEFLDLDLPRLRSLMSYPIVVDARNLFDPTRMREAGFDYYPLGRRAVVTESAGR
jgi:UDPglucose 6-dehydrogenase